MIADYGRPCMVSAANRCQTAHMHLELMRDKAKELPAIGEPQSVRTLRVWHCKHRTLEPDGDRMTQIDLDLDVALKLDGAVEVLDEDEFLDHQTRFEYPPELIEQARAATNRAVELLEADVEPFGIASHRWLAAVGHS